MIVKPKQTSALKLHVVDSFNKMERGRVGVLWEVVNIMICRYLYNDMWIFGYYLRDPIKNI